MGHKNPKAKGGNWERQVCKRLSLWVSNLTRDDVYWRSAMSGGRATFQTRRHRNQEDRVKNQAGDISAIDPSGAPLIDAFFIECKHLANMKLDGIIYGADGELRKYWREPCEKAAQFTKAPLVIAKENFRHPIVLTTRRVYEVLRTCCKNPDNLRLTAIFPVPGIYIFHFTDFIAEVDYETLCKALKNSSVQELLL